MQHTLIHTKKYNVQKPQLEHLYWPLANVFKLIVLYIDIIDSMPGIRNMCCFLWCTQSCPCCTISHLSFWNVWICCSNERSSFSSSVSLDYYVDTFSGIRWLYELVRCFKHFVCIPVDLMAQSECWALRMIQIYPVAMKKHLNDRK